MKHSVICALLSVLCIGAAGALPLTGFYQTIDDKTNSPKSIVNLYECGDELCGKIVALYDENGVANPASDKVATEVDGNPKMIGLRIIWNMEWDADDNEYSDGKILDPQSGSEYSSVIWADKKDATKLNVRGKIGPFGRTQVWNVLGDANLPKGIK